MRRIKVAYGRTFNIGNYESARIDISMEEDIPDNAAVGDDFNRIFIYLKNKVLGYGDGEK